MHQHETDAALGRSARREPHGGVGRRRPVDSHDDRAGDDDAVLAHDDDRHLRVAVLFLSFSSS